MLAIIHMRTSGTIIIGKIIHNQNRLLEFGVSQRVGTDMKQKWVAKLMNYDYEIVDYKG